MCSGASMRHLCHICCHVCECVFVLWIWHRRISRLCHICCHVCECVFVLWIWHRRINRVCHIQDNIYGLMCRLCHIHTTHLGQYMWHMCGHIYVVLCCEYVAHQSPVSYSRHKYTLTHTHIFTTHVGQHTSSAKHLMGLIRHMRTFTTHVRQHVWDTTYDPGHHIWSGTYILS